MRLFIFLGGLEGSGRSNSLVGPGGLVGLGVVAINLLVGFTKPKHV